MKKLIIVSGGKCTEEEVARQIKSLLGENIYVETILMTEFFQKNIEGDLLLFTSEFVAKLILKHLDIEISYLIASRVINHRNIREVISIPEGTEVLLVNDSQSSALEAIEQLNEIGLNHIKYYPFYPGCGNYPKPEIVITPGEVELVPYTENNVINIGSRIVDIRTIHEIVSELQIEELLKESFVTEYIRDIVEISRSIDVSRRNALESEKMLETILNSVEHGIAFADESGTIISVNSKLESILGKKKKDLLAKEFLRLMEESSEAVLQDHKSWITELEGREVLVEVRQVNFDKKFGYLITVSYTDKISKLGHKIRRNYEKRINRKLYTFDDYLSINSEAKQVLKRAEKFSKTDATILIQGENGTGKEILAQAIHMDSYRRKNLFIPINIAAISPSLLESELFGYEEGAFTGAIKGGKMGLFEIANGGTIFIDEIGDAPLDFQVKLLRVLEEKRIRRVGALEEIPVDVRIIAATNKNLLKLVDEESFREDLFFRLNILPLKTVPLRKRRDDIKYLLMHFIDINFGKGKIQSIEELFEKEVLEFLENYKWRGNIRELINLVEYLSLIYEEKRFDSSSLHYYMLDNHKEEERVILDADELWVLGQIEKNSDGGIGRTTLAYMAKKQNKDIGEGKIRRIIKKIHEMNLIEVQRNKKGCIITEKGNRVLDHYK